MLRLTQKFNQLNFGYKIVGAGFFCLLTILGVASHLLSQSPLRKNPAVHSTASSDPRVTGTIAVCEYSNTIGCTGWQ
jgi:hypothetical protein